MFSKCANPEDGGGVKRIIMGLDRNTRYATLSYPLVLPDMDSFPPSFRTPCGFCFVEFYTHAEALASMRYISGTKLDERIIRCDLDLGYREGRQFGRGKSGGQVCFPKPCVLIMHEMTRYSRSETSIDKIMTQAGEDGVPRLKKWKLKGSARPKNATQMWSRVAPWRSAVKSGSSHSHPSWNQLLSVPGHPTMTMTALDNASGWMKILDGCSFRGTLLYFCILSSCRAMFDLTSMCCKVHLQVINEVDGAYMVNKRDALEWYTCPPKCQVHS